jgi:hypothetical protein
MQPNSSNASRGVLCEDDSVGWLMGTTPQRGAVASAPGVSVDGFQPAEASSASIVALPGPAPRLVTPYAHMRYSSVGQKTLDLEEMFALSYQGHEAKRRVRQLRYSSFKAAYQGADRSSTFSHQILRTQIKTKDVLLKTAAIAQH